VSTVVDFALLEAPELLGITGLPTARFGKDANYFSGEAAWSADLVNKFADATEVMEQTGITADDVAALSLSDARAAMVDMLQIASDALGKALDVLKTGDVDALFTLPAVTAKRALVAIYAYNANGVYLHTEGAFARAIRSGRITEDEAMRHAWRCAATWDALIGMKRKGALGWAGVATPINGLGSGSLGIAPQAIALIVLAGILGALVEIALVYIIVQSLNQAAAQRRALDQCDKLMEEGKLTEAEQCRRSVMELSNQGTNNLMDNIAKAGNVITWTIALAIIGVVVVQLYPVVSRAIKHREA
jgi:hypothetical protein